MSIFETRAPSVEGNTKLRVPQREAFEEVSKHFASPQHEREVGIILPVGCGKSGVITLIPFAMKARRALVVAPGVPIATQLFDGFDPTKLSFYQKADVLLGPPFPEPVDVKSGATNLADLKESDVVISNIQQLQGSDNKWLEALPSDFFDVIIFDEGHHNVATSWESLRKKFPAAKIINLSATPTRADGQLMAGKVIYSFPVAEAIRLGYVKRLKALVLNPTTLRFVRREDGEEISVDLDEVRRLGEEDADFRRSIVTSTETLNTIVDASIRELERLRSETGEPRLKIIASALNYQHCIQVVEAYQARGRRAGYVHSKEDGTANKRVMTQLANHELDVIVQVRKLGEGFDHPYLSVAAVFSVFANLSPFVQFAGRVMRVIEQDAPASVKNQGTVVFHAGSNVARHWSDFQEFSTADQEYFEQLLPMEGLNFDDSTELTVSPVVRPANTVEIRRQDGVSMEEVPLLENDEMRKAFETLVSNGVTPDAFRRAYELQPIPTTKIAARRASRSSLDEEVKRCAGQILTSRKVNPEGRDLDKAFLGRSNFVVVKALLDKKLNALVDRGTSEREDLSADDLKRMRDGLATVANEVVKELLDA
jgi:superfamily II DNA or RNA helicase